MRAVWSHRQLEVFNLLRRRGWLLYCGRHREQWFRLRIWDSNCATCKEKDEKEWSEDVVEVTYGTANAADANNANCANNLTLKNEGDDASGSKFKNGVDDYVKIERRNEADRIDYVAVMNSKSCRKIRLLRTLQFSQIVRATLILKNLYLTRSLKKPRWHRHARRHQNRRWHKYHGDVCGAKDANGTVRKLKRMKAARKTRTHGMPAKCKWWRRLMTISMLDNNLGRRCWFGFCKADRKCR